MKRIYPSLITAAAALLPLAAFAQPADSAPVSGSRIDILFQDILVFINYTLVPVIFALAFIVFLWFVFVYFIAGGADEEKRSKGKQFVMWSLIGFVLMFAIWGIIFLILNTLGNPELSPRPSFPKFLQ